MTPKQLLIEQFTVSYEENGWFVALKNAIANLTAEQADWKPNGVEHSVRELLTHLNYWNERWLRRFRNEEIETSPEIAETFFDEQNEFTEAELTALINKTFEIFDSWKDILENINEAKLNEQVSENYDSEWAYPLANMQIHNAYHIGQIVLLRKLQGNWDTSKGVS